MRKWVLTGFVFLIVLFINIPLINVILTSLKTDADITASTPKIIFKPTVENFVNILTSSSYNFSSFFLNSLTVSILASLLVIVITLPAAYVIVRLRFGSGNLLTFITGLRLFPPIILGVPYYIIYQFIGIVDTLLELILVNVFMNLPLGLLLMVGFVRELPVDVEESAKIDGCSIYGILFRITFPLMKPGIITVGVLTFIFTWNDYLFALILSLDKATTITLGAAFFITSWGIQWGNVAAIAFLATIPPLILLISAQKYLVSGLSMGAVKG